MKDTILAVTGRPGLYKLLSQGRGNLIVETLDETKRRFPVGQRDRVTSLNDITMYSDVDDVPLMEIFQNIFDKHEGKPVDLKPKKASEQELAQFMEEALPTYDRDRVHFSDIRKLLQWYNILVAQGFTEFVTKEEEKEEETEA